MALPGFASMGPILVPAVDPISGAQFGTRSIFDYTLGISCPPLPTFAPTSDFPDCVEVLDLAMLFGRRIVEDTARDGLRYKRSEGGFGSSGSRLGW